MDLRRGEMNAIWNILGVLIDTVKDLRDIRHNVAIGNLEEARYIVHGLRKSIEVIGTWYGKIDERRKGRIYTLLDEIEHFIERNNDVQINMRVSELEGIFKTAFYEMILGIITGEQEI